LSASVLGNLFRRFSERFDLYVYCQCTTKHRETYPHRTQHLPPCKLAASISALCWLWAVSKTCGTVSRRQPQVSENCGPHRTHVVIKMAASVYACWRRGSTYKPHSVKYRISNIWKESRADTLSFPSPTIRIRASSQAKRLRSHELEFQLSVVGPPKPNRKTA